MCNGSLNAEETSESMKKKGRLGGREEISRKKREIGVRGEGG